MSNPQDPSRPNVSRNTNNQRLAPSARQPTGSATHTITPADPSSSRSASPEPLILRLRGAHEVSETGTTRLRRRITWAEDVIDNEGLGRKSSKVCCIYHKERQFGESSSEDDSSSDDSSDSDGGGSDSADDGGARMSGNRRGRKSDRGHKHGDDCNHNKAKRKPSPNAYEKMPKYNSKPSAVKS
ncbi:uncharacterized protein A1O9_08863 [Exophiala aquamarina CBS 119918]|uniref:Type 1 phosphatases regulator n=1 Tax=Exophiala aquamarina CBS 119918 TaxID=1182545 RepID=A0A072P524_9EURO|nr:uncharacterized protein A1O9_08863 [Exophiala aquamarina CBS 119918]KEF55209.1 hypothetical protein A1O9_08863 [Exophiala aquamarina CBS 119918]